MSDISLFQKILEQAGGKTAPPAPKVIWISAAARGAGLYVYHVGVKGWPLARLFTFDLATARDAGGQLGAITGRIVKEAGPPEAFGRPRQPPQSTIDAFWHLVRTEDAGRLNAWLAEHPHEAPFLVRLLDDRERS
jgi:hypothetical protein